MSMVPMGAWLPDLPAYQNPGCLEAKNVLPRLVGRDPRGGPLIGYEPLYSLSAATNALDARARGAFTGRDASNNATNFAGDASKLYKLATATWEDKSDTGGYTLTGTNVWRFAQYGLRVMATCFDEPIQSWVLGTSSAFADLSADAPKAKFIAIWRDFVVAGYTYDAGDGNVPNRVWWSGIDDPTSWPTPGGTTAAQVQSDYQNIPTGGAVTGLVGAVGVADGAVFLQSAIYRVSYIGPPFVFQFDEVEGAKGATVPGSVVYVSSTADTPPVVAYWAEDGFYLFDGNRSMPIGDGQVDRWFAADFDLGNADRMTGIADVERKLILWSYPSVNNSNGGGTPDKIIAFNWETGSWSYGMLSCEMLYRAVASSTTLDGLDSYSSSIDAISISLDSQFWVGGGINVGAFDTTHKQATFSATSLEAIVESGEFGGDQRVFVSGVRPYVDGGVTDGDVTISIGYRSSPDASVSYTTATEAGVDGICPQRISTRFARARVTIAAGANWTVLQGVEPFSRAEGRR